MSNGHTVEQFIQIVLLKNLRTLVYDCKLLYLAYGQIAVGIEFLGACHDQHPFDQLGQSGNRFRLGITEYLAKIDARYDQYNDKDSPYDLYRHLRCGMAHVFRPQGKVGMIGAGNAAESKVQHLEINQKHDKLILVAERFDDDFDKACGLLLKVLPTMQHPKLQSVFLPVNEV